MRVLFIHQNFPGQYKSLAPALVARGHEVVALSITKQPNIPGVRAVQYQPTRGTSSGIHPWVSDYETKVIRGEAAGKAMLSLKDQGFVPDVVCVHPGWGEGLFVKDVYPETRVIGFHEFYYHATGADVGFDPEFSRSGFNELARVRLKNAHMLLSYEVCDQLVSPTYWQASTAPESARSKMHVLHDGVNTDVLTPNPKARVRLGNGLELGVGDEVLTFINRNLEPYRGYHVFMRALPEIMKERPNVQVIIIGGDGVSYGAKAPDGKKWKDIFLDEVRDKIDMNRVHFMGQVPYEHFKALVQISRAHVYLTYPFVLSWSMIEAMSMGALLIGSDTPPVSEVIEHGHNGLLVDFFDVAALASTTIDALAQPGKFVGLRSEARKTAVERYDLHRVCLPGHVALVEGTA